MGSKGNESGRERGYIRMGRLISGKETSNTDKMKFDQMGSELYLKGRKYWKWNGKYN